MTGPVVRVASHSDAVFSYVFLGELFWLAPVVVPRHSVIIKPMAVTAGDLPGLRCAIVWA